MKKSTLVLSAGFCLLVIVMASAQEVARAEDILKWFPQGTYHMIQHSDNDMLRQASAYDRYLELFGLATKEEKEAAKAEKGEKEKGGRDIPEVSFFIGGGVHTSLARTLLPEDLSLPPSLREDVVSSTVANATDLVDSPNDGPSVAAVTLESQNGNKPAVGVFIMRRSSMEVHRFFDLESAIAKALEAGEIAATGRKLRGRPVYTFKTDKEGPGGSTYYAWGSDMGELLVSGDRKYLRKMIQAGYGELLRLLDHRDYIDLVNLVPELGAKWNATALKSTSRAIAQAADEGSIPEEQAERIIERSEASPLLKIDTLKIDNRILSVEYKVYEEDEHAEKGMQTGSPTFPGEQNTAAMDEYQRALNSRKSVERDGNIIMTTVELDRDLIEAEKKANAQMQQYLMSGKIMRTGDGKQMRIKIERISPETDEKKK
jgi:hypothetical protein